jgi:PAS domain S-box-containing protein
VAWLREGRWGLDNAPFQLTVQTNTMSTWTPVLILAGVLLGCLVLSLTLDLYAARRLAGGLKNDLDALRPGHKDQIHHFTSTEAAALAKAWDQEDRLQRQLLDRLDAQERFQWDILRGLPVPVLVSQDGVVIQANEQALQLFGRTAEQLKGQASADCLHPDERPRVMPLLKHVRSTPGAAEQLSTRIVRGDGTIQAIEVSLARVESGTGPLVLSVLRVQADDNGDEGPCGSASGLRAGARLNALT